MDRRAFEHGPEAPAEGNSEVVSRSAVPSWDLWLALTVAALAAFLLPLDDADLPMHLRTGAWILEHGRLPLVEPFAWTRAGAPFFAYSWLPEVAYAAAWARGGALSLSAVHALLLVGVTLALWQLARAARWTPWTTRLVLSVHLVLWLVAQPATRPQLLLAITFPIAWAMAYRLRDAAPGGTPWGAVLALIGANALAVNAHLFFFLLLAPVVVLLAEAPVPRTRLVLFVLATVVGWLCTPYLQQLPGILALNLGANALLGAASPISELEGGFHVLLRAPIGTRLLAGGLLLLPLLPAMAERSLRARWWFGLSWLAGLGLFALAVRGLVLWWLLALPLVAEAVARIPLPRLASTYRMVVLAWVVSLVSLVGQANKLRALGAGGGAPLPHPAATALEPAVAWLTCATPTGGSSATADARAVTAFDYGSYLAWRVPQLSWSIDGRAIFPDSVARADARQELRQGTPVAPPWRSARVVLLPAAHATVGEIAADSAWRRVPLHTKNGTALVALLVRRELADAASACADRVSSG